MELIGVGWSFRQNGVGSDSVRLRRKVYFLFTVCLQKSACEVRPKGSTLVLVFWFGQNALGTGSGEECLPGSSELAPEHGAYESDGTCASGERICASTLWICVLAERVGVSGYRLASYRIGNVNVGWRESDRMDKWILSKSRKLLAINVIFFGLFFRSRRKCANFAAFEDRGQRERSVVAGGSRETVKTVDGLFGPPTPR